MNGVHRQMQTNHLFVVRADGVLRSLIMTPCAGDPMFPCSLRIPRSALMVLVSTLALAFSMPAQAAYPDRPVRLIVPFPAGGTVDFVARLVATQLGQQLATSVVVENVPGAGGTLATARVAKSAADGYTLLFTTPNHTINPSLISKLPFDTEKDLAPVSLVAEIPELLVAHIAQPFNTFAEFVAHAKANPGKLNYASAGNGTLPHVTMELMLQRLGLQVTHVAYRGAAPALNDLLGGVVAAKMDTIATSSQHMKAGRIKPLAIASLKRSPLMPDVPTVAESGVPGYQGILWMGILVPAGTDAALISTLHKAIAAMASVPTFQQQLKADGVDLVASDPQTFAKLIHTELAQWAEVVRKSQIKAD
jgi:tripartite-type tricarboxylate transporter receptor subunit TctC